MKVLVVGLYNSGSSYLAETLSGLDIHMGYNKNEHEEESLLTNEIKRWWDEPRMVESVPKEERRHYIKLWTEYQQSRFAQYSLDAIGFKHPLTILSLEDFQAVWPDVKIIWSWRDLDKSIERLEVRQWFNEPKRMQLRLWDELKKLDGIDHLKVSYDDHVENKEATIKLLKDYLNL